MWVFHWLKSRGLQNVPCCTVIVLQGPEELFETVSQALLSGQDRDCLAGWGAVVYVM